MYMSPINLRYEASPSPIFEKIEQAVADKTREIHETIDKNVSDQCIQIAYKCGIDINKEDLIAALKADRERYEQAYQLGYKAGKLDALRELAPFKNTDMWEVPDND